jgi:hypothetical protein
MNFLWPQSLWLTLALPVLPALYLLLLRRRGKPALRYSSLRVAAKHRAAASGGATCRPHCSGWLVQCCCWPLRVRSSR